MLRKTLRPLITTPVLKLHNGGGIAIDASKGWGQGLKVTRNQANTPLKLQISTIHNNNNNNVMAQGNSTVIPYTDRRGMFCEVSGGTPVATDMLFSPASKSDSEGNAIRLCIAGGGHIAQAKQSAASPT